MDTQQHINGNVARLAGEASCEILDDLERIHLQLHVMEFRSREGLSSSNTLGDRLSELADEVKSLRNRIAMWHRNPEENAQLPRG